MQFQQNQSDRLLECSLEHKPKTRLNEHSPACKPTQRPLRIGARNLPTRRDNAANKTPQMIVEEMTMTGMRDNARDDPT